jgi:hypothetical protein
MSYVDYYTKQALRSMNLAGPFKRNPPLFNQFNLSGMGELQQTGDPWKDFISVMQDFVENPKEYAGAQDEGVQVEADMLNVLTSVRDTYYACSAMTKSIQRINKQYGDSLILSLNQYQVKHDSIYNRYMALKSKNVVVIEDLQAFIPELQNLLAELNTFKANLTEKLKDPTGLQNIVEDKGFISSLFDFGITSSVTKVLKYGVIFLVAYGAFKIVPGMMKKKEPAKK